MYIHNVFKCIPGGLVRKSILIFGDYALGRTGDAIAGRGIVNDRCIFENGKDSIMYFEILFKDLGECKKFYNNIC